MTSSEQAPIGLHDLKCQNKPQEAGAGAEEAGEPRRGRPELMTTGGTAESDRRPSHRMCSQIKYVE
jgi:hypothetical protein